MITEDTNVPQGGFPLLGTIDAHCSTSLPIALEESSCVDDVVETDTLGSQDAEGDETGNKFLYPEFAGYEGYVYLASIVMQILPRALAQTWEAAVSYQAPNNTCYVSSGRILRDKKVKAQDERTLRRHWQTMRQQGLVSIKPVVKMITDKRGSHLAAVAEKDFAGLYHLAHEYHEWLQTSYAYFPPTRDLAPALLQNQELARKLVKFDCYRRVLLHDAPGPKPVCPLSDEDINLKEMRDALAAEADVNLQKNAKRNIYLNTLPDISSQDRNRKDSFSRDTLPNTNGVASSAEPEEIVAAGAQAIGNTEKQTSTLRSDRATKERTTERNSPNRNVETLEQPMKAPTTATPDPVVLEKIGNAGKRELPAASREQIEQMTARTPKKLIEQIVPLVQCWLNDQASEAYVTHTLTKFFRDRAIFDPAAVKRAILLALAQAYAVPAEEIRKCNPDGSPNWIPKFYVALDHVWSRAVFQPIQPTQDELEPQEQRGVDAESEQIEPGEEAHEEEAVDLLQDFLRQAELYQVDVSAEQRELIALGDAEAIDELTVRLRAALTRNEADQRWVAYQKDACHQITHACSHIQPSGAPPHHKRLMVFKRPCRHCGSSIAYQADDRQYYCAVCMPSYQWSQPLQRQVQAIIMNLPSYATLFAEVNEEYFGASSQDVEDREDQS